MVLPAPTSPCSSRCIGQVRCMSATISASASRCPSVSLNGNTARAHWRMRSSTFETSNLRTCAFSWRRSARPVWNTKKSSNTSRRCAGVVNAIELVDVALVRRESAPTIARSCDRASARASGCRRERGSNPSSGNCSSACHTNRRCMLVVTLPVRSYTGTMRPVCSCSVRFPAPGSRLPGPSP